MRDMIKKMTGRRQTKYKRLSQRCVNNKKGVSLVGVIVAFLLLMIIMLMFQKSLKVSGNLIARSVDIRKEEQELIGDYYKNRTSPTNTESVSCVFSGEDGSFTLNTKWSSYSRQNASIFTLEMEQLDMKIVHQPCQMEVMSSEEDKRQ